MRERIKELNEQGVSDVDIAKELGVTRARIQFLRSKRLGLPRTVKWKRERTCPGCGKLFSPTKIGQERCSKDGRFTDKTCPLCGKVYRGFSSSCIPCRIRERRRGRADA